MGNHKQELNRAHDAAEDAVRAYSEKNPIVNKRGKVNDHACSSGRVIRFFQMANKAKIPDKKKKEIAERLEREAAALLEDAQVKIRAYVALCMRYGEEPQLLDVAPCDCGYCSGVIAGRKELLWEAEGEYRRTVFEMLAGEDAPNFSKEAVGKAEDAFALYAAYAKALGFEADLKDLFYGGW